MSDLHFQTSPPFYWNDRFSIGMPDLFSLVRADLRGCVGHPSAIVIRWLSLPLCSCRRRDQGGSTREQIFLVKYRSMSGAHRD